MTCNLKNIGKCLLISFYFVFWLNIIVWNNGILISRIKPFPVLLKLASIPYIVILVAKLVSKFPLAGMIHLLRTLLTSVVWIQMGHLFPENNFLHVLLNSKHFCKLTVEENTAVLEKCPENYIVFKRSSFKLFYFIFLSRLSQHFLSYLLHKFCFSVLKMRLFHIPSQIMWLLLSLPIFYDSEFSASIFQNSDIMWFTFI